MRCTLCKGALTFLGNHGGAGFYRCRNCGADQSGRTQTESEPDYEPTSNRHTREFDQHEREEARRMKYY